MSHCVVDVLAYEPMRAAIAPTSAGVGHSPMHLGSTSGYWRLGCGFPPLDHTIGIAKIKGFKG